MRALGTLGFTLIFTAAAGAALPARVGSEFQINSYTTSSQGDPAVAVDADGFVIEDSSTPTPIQLLRVDEATGNLSKDFQLFLHTTGTSNTFVGATAGPAITSGEKNAAFGSSALAANQEGSNIRRSGLKFGG
jgi:hypothetical protein